MRVFLPSVEGSTEGASQGAEPRGMPPRLIPTHEVEYPIRTSTDDSIIISLWSAATGEAGFRRSRLPAKPFAGEAVCRRSRLPAGCSHLYANRMSKRPAGWLSPIREPYEPNTPATSERPGASRSSTDLLIRAPHPHIHVPALVPGRASDIKK